MARTRLLVSHKSILMGFARKNVNTPKETRAYDRAYARASQLVREDVEKRFPPKDIELLRKYEAIHSDITVSGGSPSGHFVSFTFDDCDTPPPTCRDYIIKRTVRFRRSTCDAIERHNIVLGVRDAAKDSILKDFKALINASRTYEELIDVWPGAIAMKDKICEPSTALSVLSDEAVARIKKSNIQLKEVA